MYEFIVYSRRGCHLCEEMLELLEPLCRGRAKISVRDVDSNSDWLEVYGMHVPVLCCDDEELCRYQLDRQRVIDFFAEQNS